MMLVGLGALAMAWSDRGAERVSATVIVPASVQQQFTGSDGAPIGEAGEKANRPIYPMSVVPGGAYSVAELREYLKADPVARQSFEAQAKRLNDPELVEHLVVRTVAKPTKMYSQLRKGTKLCWTSRPVTVEAGESGFYSTRSDDLVARARCGNVMITNVPAGELQVAPPPPQPIGWTPPTVQVAPESGARPPEQPQVVVAGERGVAPPVLVPQRVASIPPITIPPATIITPPAAAAAPPVVIPPYVPPTQVLPPQQQQQLPSLRLGGGTPWWGLLGGGLLGGAAGRSTINITQKQKQKQKQDCGDDDTEPIPEPGTMLLMTLGLGAASGLMARRRKKH